MKHYDCKYYLSIDVFKGICKRDKKNIIADEDACGSFENARKCKHCSNFTLNGADLGKCLNKYDAYPEMTAITCNDFKSE
jgi:4-hydroxyphenylacetate decarboxylase small subunit